MRLHVSLSTVLAVVSLPALASAQFREAVEAGRVPPAEAQPFRQRSDAAMGRINQQASPESVQPESGSGSRPQTPTDGGLASPEDEVERVIAETSKAIGSNKKDPASLVKRGDAFYAKQEFDKALIDYEAALQVDPKFADAYAGRGYAVLASHQPSSGALKDFEQAIRLDPNNADAYFGRFGLRFRSRQFARLANSDLKRAVDLDPTLAAYLSQEFTYVRVRKFRKESLRLSKAIGIEEQERARRAEEQQAIFQQQQALSDRLEADARARDWRQLDFPSDDN